MSERKRYWRLGLTLFLTACAVLIFYDTFYMGGTLQSFVTKLVATLAPVLYGFVMAYLLAPIVNLAERLLRRGAGRVKAWQGKKITRSNGWVRAVSILLAWLFVGLLIYILMALLIPELVESIKLLISNAETYYDKVYNWINGFFNGESGSKSAAKELLDRYYDDALNILEQHVLPWAQSTLTSLTDGIWTGIWSVVSFFKNFIIGVIVSVYMLAMKEKSAARCRKMIYGLFTREHAAWIMRATRRVDDIFSGFVRGKLLDSLIIGVLCFIGCSILRMPYTPLVSVIVGVTNVIPFFGPFLGAVPSAFLILLVSPVKCLYFVIFVFALQQLDGNVIGPKILGGSTGISSFWVVVAILVGGGFGGVPGMFLGVPICACLQALLKYLVDGRLRKRNMPTEAYYYTGQADPPAESEKKTE
ncbi:MAG: AI-2E family transporter [Oscillospiraceae bacterium]|nr:AI-2E family transporter [Oscillospiraceae bacterium]